MTLETDMVAELVEATQEGWWQDVERLLNKQGAATGAAAAFDVNQYISDIGGTLLGEAARHGHARIARLLIDHGASVHKMDEFGETPFAIASKQGHIQVGCLLLDNGADPYSYNEIGRTALEDAKDCITEQALKEHYEKRQNDAKKNRLQSSSSGVRHILPRNDSLNDFLNEEDTSQNSDNAVEQGGDEEESLEPQDDIIQATVGGKVDIVRKLLDENEDNVNKHYNDEAGTLLHLACRSNQVEVATILLDKGAGIDSLDGEGLTPLHIASEEGFVELIKLLLDHNADVMIQDPECRTPFDIAKDDATLRVLLNCSRELDVEVVSVLDHVGEQEAQSVSNEAAEADTESTATDVYYAKFDLLLQQRHEEQQTLIEKLQENITLLREKDEQRKEEFKVLQAVVASLEEQVNEQKQNTNSCEQNSKLIREQSMDLEDLEERLARVEDGLQETQLNLVVLQQQQQQQQQPNEPEKQEEQMRPEETVLVEAENTLLKVENENQKIEIALLRMKVAEYAQMEQEQEAQQKQEKQKEKQAKEKEKQAKEKEKQAKEKEKQAKEKEKQAKKDLFLINLNSSIHNSKYTAEKKDFEPRPEYEDDGDDNENGINKKLLGFSIDNGKSTLFSFPDFFGDAEEKEKEKAAQADVDCARKTPDQSMEAGPVEV